MSIHAATMYLFRTWNILHAISLRSWPQSVDIRTTYLVIFLLSNVSSWLEFDRNSGPSDNAAWPSRPASGVRLERSLGEVANRSSFRESAAPPPIHCI